MSDEAAQTPEEAVKLRGDPPRVMRLSRKAIGIASACGFALVGGALIGWVLDRLFGTSPWLLLVFLGLGIVAAFRNIIRLTTVKRPDQ